ncbi:alpha/beta hydrolase [Cellulosimicrobium protaetiae]|uniref:Alpha/beta hydrolase fold domain-containing protein n=1 Tax=Cellulosimicrobium protaetiae TaxID=2587808 RepID=A0A6M5UAM6_9MICO|nr:alpha/beta hydrolase fold domain-containing protein [Cellulosimicrobium protaetiae]QJW35280.1 alpha/beta hydrolase fold domain-containing protein [Cellulosimicrobium protaetiae]
MGDDLDPAEVSRLRRGARERALARPRRPFAGTVADSWVDGRAVRSYAPTGYDPSAAVVFLHGGYGLFGDLELQDDPCRRIAAALGARVVAVDYRLAPESSLDDAVTDTLAALRHLAREGVGRTALFGDSAGGAVAVATARRAHDTPLAPAWLALTNPNLDLTLGSFDTTRPGGPDAALSAASFRAWARVDRLADAPRLDLDATGLPPTFVAVGEQDSLLPEVRTLAASCARDGVPCELVEVPGASHGFLGGDDAPAVLAALRAFVRDAGPPSGARS